MRSLKFLVKASVLFIGVYGFIGCGASNSGKANSSTGQKNTTSAKVTFEAPIESVDLVTNTITVASHTFQITDVTAFVTDTNDVETINTGALSAYQVGDKVVIEGHKDGSGVMIVERLVTEIDTAEEAGDAGDVNAKISGPIESITSDSFVILGNKIMLASDAKFTKVKDSAEFFAFIKVGAVVEIDGELKDGFILADEIELDAVEEDDGEQLDDGDVEDFEAIEFAASVGGPVESINGESFKILGVTITLEDDATYEGISNRAAFLSALKVGSFVEVEGSFVNGILEGEEIDFGAELEVGLGGAIEAINGETFTILGVTVEIDTFAAFIGVANNAEFLNSLAVGQYVEVKGVLKSGLLEADEIEVGADDLEDDANDSEVDEE